MRSIGEDLVVAHVPRIVGIDTLVRVRGDATVGFGNDKSIGPSDRDKRRADSYFNSNPPPPLSPDSLASDNRPWPFPALSVRMQRRANVLHHKPAEQ